MPAAAVAFAAGWTLTPAWNAASAPAARPSPDAATVHYAGCDEVRAAGAAPLHRGQPGYREDMDGDDDGIACEPHRRGG